MSLSHLSYHRPTHFTTIHSLIRHSAILFSVLLYFNQFSFSLPTYSYGVQKIVGALGTRASDLRRAKLEPNGRHNAQRSRSNERCSWMGRYLRYWNWGCTRY